jgi:hypothetical protein
VSSRTEASGAIPEMRPNSTAGSRRMPPSVQSWQSQYWRWPWRDCSCAWRRWRLASSDTVRSAAIGRYPTWDLAHAENGRRRIGVGRLCYSCHTVNFLKRGLSNSTRLRCCDEFCGYGEL